MDFLGSARSLCLSVAFLSFFFQIPDMVTTGDEAVWVLLLNPCLLNADYGQVVEVSQKTEQSLSS